ELGRRIAAATDAQAAAVIGIFFVILAALSWQAWGSPSVDAGHELTVASMIAEGHQPYLDIRYFYGPLGVYALGGTFAVFGASFTTAFAFGLVQAAAICAVFYLLARRLLDVVTACVATLIVAAIGFSGTAFNFVLPHTNSATFGLLTTLLMLLALSHKRLVLASVAAGLVCLTRPEFAAIAVLTLGAYLLGTWRQEGWGPTLRALPRLAIPGLLLAGVVYTVLAAEAGASLLFTENLWPVKMLRVAGFASQEAWAPKSLEGLVATLARAGAYLLLFGSVVAAAVLVARERTTGERIKALWPLPFAVVLIGFVDLAWRVLGIWEPAREAVQEEMSHLIIGMSWLPALGFIACVLLAMRFLKGKSAPITGNWAFDLALVACAAALGARAYDAFTAEGSYAPYYAPPLVLLLAVLHDRVSKRWPQARAAVTLALLAVAVGLAAYAAGALYPHQGTVVHTERGSFKTTAASAPALQGTLNWIDSHTEPGEAVLAVPADAGIDFMADRKVALYNPMFLPGLLYSQREEREAIARLEAEDARYAVVDKRNFDNYPDEKFGVEYNRPFAAWIERKGAPVAEFGDGARVGGENPATSFAIYDIGGPG
ncbi:MAG: hypothetical protein ACRDPE_15135, partial [Solirubrobacterales bacterium]